MLKAAWKYLRWLYLHSEGVRGRLVLNVLLGILNVALNLAFIFVCKRIVDIATGVVPGDIITFTIVVLVLIACRLAVSALNVRIEALASSKLNFIIRQDLYSNLLNSEWAGKELRHSGDTLNRLETDVNSVVSVIGSDAPQFITTLVQLVAATIFLCTMQWKLALLLVVMTPLFLGFSKLFFRKLREMTRGIRDTESKVQSHLQESLQHRVVIKSMESESRMEDRLEELQNNEYGQVIRRTRLNVFARTIVGAAFSFGYIAAFLWGAFGIWKGTLTFGIMTAFLQLVGQIQRPVVNMTHQIPSFVNATASIDRLMELEDAPRGETGTGHYLEGPAGIKVDNLSFHYPDSTEDVIKDLSFDFPPGSRTAIVGETGVGKSTLVRIMLSLLKPDKGGVYIYNGEQNIQVSARTRCNMVYVPQGNSLFSGTIRDNLYIGDPEATEERMWKALDTAAAEFVRDLPDGLETKCGEGGAGLSEGQAQRIAIARGLLRPGSILLLDEFSASLDPETEARLMNNLAKEAAGKTMIFIAHRDKVMASCERTLRLKA
ncbi:MAG: ABC transporter ATP-binding protein [Bacteroidales bacterium]|nr:ABC transporter ATP-binding protein [Bacteroidales bacterium]